MFNVQFAIFCISILVTNDSLKYSYFQCLSAAQDASAAAPRGSCPASRRTPGAGCGSRRPGAGRTWGICTRRAGKLFKARYQLYQSQTLQENDTKNALESSRRDLHNAPLCTVLQSNPKNQENHGGKTVLVGSVWVISIFR